MLSKFLIEKLWSCLCPPGEGTPDASPSFPKIGDGQKKTHRRRTISLATNSYSHSHYAISKVSFLKKPPARVFNDRFMWHCMVGKLDSHVFDNSIDGDRHGEAHAPRGPGNAITRLIDKAVEGLRARSRNAFENDERTHEVSSRKLIVINDL